MVKEMSAFAPWLQRFKEKREEEHKESGNRKQWLHLCASFKTLWLEVVSTLEFGLK